MSNELGEIYGTVKDGKGSIIINSNIVEISGNLTTRGHIQLLNTNHEIAEADPSGILTRIDNLDNSLNILLTSNNDASFNNVDVSGSLNVQGEKVMTVPALDICGNDLSANTTYEITTGPPGSINNISFVKKQQAFINWECTGSAKNFNLNQIRDGGNGSDIIGAGHVTSGKNLISTSTITRGGQQVLQASNIDINTPANGRITVTLPGLYSISAEAGGYLSGQDERYFALMIYINDTQYGARMVSQVNGSTGDGSNGHGMVSISAVAMLEAQDVIHFTITGGSQDNANTDDIQGQIVKIN